jgi:hypothetical protein
MYIGIFVSYVLSFVFLVFALVGFGLRSDADRFPFPSRNFAPRCKESLEPMLRIVPAAAMCSA